MTGWIIGGIACILYMLGVGFAAYKKSPGLVKLIKLKLGKNMSDKAAVTTAWIAAGVVGAFGIFCFIMAAI